jgi:hypothetical protein
MKITPMRFVLHNLYLPWLRAVSREAMEHLRLLLCLVILPPVRGPGCKGVRLGSWHPAAARPRAPPKHLTSFLHHTAVTRLLRCFTVASTAAVTWNFTPILRYRRHYECTRPDLRRPSSPVTQPSFAIPQQYVHMLPPN